MTAPESMPTLLASTGSEPASSGLAGSVLDVHEEWSPPDGGTSR